MNGSALPSVRHDPASAKPKRQRRSVWPFALRLTAGLVAVGVLLRVNGAQRIFDTLSRERPGWFAAAVALYLGGQVMSSYRWKLLGGLAGLRSPWRDFLRYYFVGMFTNLFVPGLIGGDAARAAYIGIREHRAAAAAASVVADRGIGLGALVWFAAAALSLNRATLPTSLIHATYLIAGLGVAAFISGPILAGPLEAYGSRRPKLVGVVLPYLRRPIALIPAILLSWALQASLVLCQYWLGCGMGLRVSFRELLAIVPLANIAASLPVTLNGLGVREGAYLVLLGAGGVSHDAAITLGLAWFSATELGGLAGAIPFFITDLSRPESRCD